MADIEDRGTSTAYSRAKWICFLELIIWSGLGIHYSFSFTNEYYANQEIIDLKFKEKIIGTSVALIIDLTLTFLLISAICYKSLLAIKVWLVVKTVETLTLLSFKIFQLIYSNFTKEDLTLMSLIAALWTLYRIFILYFVNKFKKELEYEERRINIASYYEQSSSNQYYQYPRDSFSHQMQYEGGPPPCGPGLGPNLGPAGYYPG